MCTMTNQSFSWNSVSDDVDNFTIVYLLNRRQILPTSVHRITWKPFLKVNMTNNHCSVSGKKQYLKYINIWRSPLVNGKKKIWVYFMNFKLVHWLPMESEARFSQWLPSSRISKIHYWVCIFYIIKSNDSPTKTIMTLASIHLLLSWKKKDVIKSLKKSF